MFPLCLRAIRTIPLVALGVLNSCGWLGTPGQTAKTRPEVIVTAAPAPEAPTPKLANQTKETRWILAVDKTATTGKIDLSLDPKGNLLGAKPAQDTAPFGGKILVTVRTDANGTRSIRFEDVRLANAAGMLMPFKWSRLVGRIAVNIPEKVLQISRHSFPGWSTVRNDGSFDIPGNFFTVGGQAKVQGSGLVLSKAVGKRDIDLTIRKTEPVHLTGKLTVRDGIATLHIPGAVMRDQFDLEGSLLKLTFTGNITARSVTR